VLGTSAAAGIVANLAVRYPAVVRGAVFHEPIFPSGVTNPPADRAARRELIEDAMATDGPRGATEAFLRSVGGDMVYDSLDSALRERLLGNGGVFFSIERHPFIAYEPTPTSSRACGWPGPSPWGPITAVPIADPLEVRNNRVARQPAVDRSGRAAGRSPRLPGRPGSVRADTEAGPAGTRLTPGPESSLRVPSR
jgi:hypothetical protein